MELDSRPHGINSPALGPSLFTSRQVSPYPDLQRNPTQKTIPLSVCSIFKAAVNTDGSLEPASDTLRHFKIIFLSLILDTAALRKALEEGERATSSGGSARRRTSE